MGLQAHAHLQTLDRLPQTLCHGDPQRHNLFTTTGAEGRPAVVAIDWGNAGLGPVGADAAGFACSGMFNLQTSLDQIAEQVEQTFEAYLAGMRAAGWAGDPRLVRLGFTSSMVRVKAMVVNRSTQIVFDDAVRARIVRGFRAQGATLEDVFDRVRDLVTLLDGWLKESYALRDALL